VMEDFPKFSYHRAVIVNDPLFENAAIKIEKSFLKCQFVEEKY
jgi:hypothetical protein